MIKENPKFFLSIFFSRIFFFLDEWIAVLLIITQNAVPTKGEAIEGKRLRVVSHHYSESFMLFGEFEALSDSTVKSNRLMQGHGGPPSMVSLVNTPTCKHKEGRG